MEGIISKRANRVNYEEDDSDNEETSIIDAIGEMSEDAGTQSWKGTFAKLNLQKQYKRAFLAAQKREDCSILDEKNVPKGEPRKDSIYFYLELHPGIFQLAAQEISKFLCQDQNIKHKSGKPDRYGGAKIKNMCYFTFKLEVKT